MTYRIQRAVFLLYFFALLPAAWGRASGSGMAGLSGAPGENTCTRCHTGAVNSGSGTLTITPDSMTFTAGQQIRLRITLADSGGRRWGYELSARRASAPASALGTLSPPDSLTQVLTSGGIQYAVQTNAGTQAGTANSASWDVVWTAPADLSGGAVTFYAVGLACATTTAPTGATAPTLRH